MENKYSALKFIKNSAKAVGKYVLLPAALMTTLMMGEAKAEGLDEGRKPKPVRKMTPPPKKMTVDKESTIVDKLKGEYNNKQGPVVTGSFSDEDDGIKGLTAKVNGKPVNVDIVPSTIGNDAEWVINYNDLKAGDKVVFETTDKKNGTTTHNVSYNLDEVKKQIILDMIANNKDSTFPDKITKDNYQTLNNFVKDVNGDVSILINGKAYDKNTIADIIKATGGKDKITVTAVDERFGKQFVTTKDFAPDTFMDLYNSLTGSSVKGLTETKPKETKIEPRPKPKKRIDLDKMLSLTAHSGFEDYQGNDLSRAKEKLDFKISKYGFDLSGAFSALHSRYDFTKIGEAFGRIGYAGKRFNFGVSGGYFSDNEIFGELQNDLNLFDKAYKFGADMGLNWKGGSATLGASYISGLASDNALRITDGVDEVAIVDEDLRKFENGYNIAFKFDHKFKGKKFSLTLFGNVDYTKLFNNESKSFDGDNTFHSEGEAELFKAKAGIIGEYKNLIGKFEIGGGRLESGLKELYVTGPDANDLGNGGVYTPAKADIKKFLEMDLGIAYKFTKNMSAGLNWKYQHDFANGKDNNMLYFNFNIDL